MLNTKKSLKSNKRKEITKVVNGDELPEHIRKYFATTEAGVPQKVTTNGCICSHSVWSVGA